MKQQIGTELLLEQLKDVHKWFVATLDGVTDEVAAFMPPGKANPISGVYAHLVFSEDFFVQMLLQGKKPLMETAWANKTGASEVQPSEWEVAYPKWLRTVKVDMAAMNTYANAVFSASESYLASLNDADLMKEVDMSAFGMGKRSAGSVWGGIIIGHAYSIMGEIAVLKGIQGLKGYPF